jgi:hypothetical protein
MDTAPLSCIRPAKGSITYEVFGWHPAPGVSQVGLLVPMTLMNLASLAICVAAMVMGRFKYRSDIEPTSTRSLLAARVVDTNGDDSDEAGQGKDKTVGWDNRVRF